MKDISCQHHHELNTGCSSHYWRGKSSYLEQKLRESREEQQRLERKCAHLDELKEKLVHDIFKLETLREQAEQENHILKVLVANLTTHD